MNSFQLYVQNNKDTFVKLILLFVAFTFVGGAFLFDDISTIIDGMKIILTHSDKLICDYVEIGGYGATFINVGLLMIASVFLLHLSKAKITGVSIASITLMGGFGFFGKNILNIWPILLGVFLYARVNRHLFSQHISIAFFGTSLAPLVTEVALWQDNLYIGIALAILIGVIVGFILVPISSQTLHVHQGYNLYNVGFSGGLIGTVMISIMTSFGYADTSQLLWYDKSNTTIVIFMFALFLFFMILGFIIDPKCMQTYKTVLKKSGRLIADFLSADGIAVVLFNMGLLGIVYTSFILLVGGTLNGPTIGGILTVVGFAGFGKHIRNTIPLTLGVILASIVKIWDINDPSVILAALFCTGLAPIVGQFGFKYGIITGFIHLSLVLSIGSYHGGVNLYNNGFSAGLVALFLIPLIEAFQLKKKARKENS